MKALHAFPLAQDISGALTDLVPLANTLPLGSQAFEGAFPVLTPEIAGVRSVACVYADPHKDLPYPRFGVLAPIVLSRQASVCVKDNNGNIHKHSFTKGQMVVFDSHLEHWVEKPSDYPSNWDELPEKERDAYKQKNMLVFANIDFQHYPTPQECERAFRRVLCLSEPSQKRKFK